MERMIVAKIGGSLCRDKEILKGLCEVLMRFHALVVPGGGEFADQVRELDRKLNLNPEISHRMALLAMDLTGLLIKNFCPGLEIVRISKEPVEELPASWDLTSDSIAAWIAKRNRAESLIILKDVDGLYERDPKKDPEAKLIPEVRREELSRIKESCLDSMFPEFLAGFQGEVWIINGKHPERLEELIEKGSTTGTRILP